MPIGEGFAVIAKGIVEKVMESNVELKQLKQFHNFCKVETTVFPVEQIKVKTKAKDISPSRNSFTSIRRGVLELSTTPVGKSGESSVISSVEARNTAQPSSPKEMETQEVELSKKTSSSNEESLVVSLANPAFMKHYNEIVDENVKMKKELSKYKKAVRTMNEMIRQMAKCVDDHVDVFSLADSTVQVGDRVIVLSHKDRAEICNLSEKTSQILHVCTTLLNKQVTQIDKEERLLVLKIIFDAMELRLDKNPTKVSKYKAVFRTVISKMKKQENGEKKKTSGEKKRGREDSESDSGVGSDGDE